MYGDGIGKTDVTGAINGRTVTVIAPIRDLAFGTPGTSGRLFLVSTDQRQERRWRSSVANRGHSSPGFRCLAPVDSPPGTAWIPLSRDPRLAPIPALAAPLGPVALFSEARSIRCVIAWQSWRLWEQRWLPS